MRPLKLKHGHGASALFGWTDSAFDPRCHEREFLLKSAQDRETWLGWLFQAKKRFGLCVLDYMVTSNHIHLLVYDRRN
jgi:hypothetical protein